MNARRTHIVLMVAIATTLFAGLFAAPVADAVLIHRYSFNRTDGVLEDSKGGADGVVQGAGGAQAGGLLTLPGGSSASAAYGDLPNGLISSLTDVTFEGWVIPDGNQNWGRLFDFGSSNNAEITGPGGSGNGTDYFTLTANRGGTPDTQRLEIRDTDPIGGASNITTTVDTNSAQPLGQEFHYAVTYDADGAGPGLASFGIYRDGAFVTGGTTSIQLGNINDVNNWLGRSNWTGDSNFQGSFDEFRIYDHPLTDTEVFDSFTAGPNANVPEPTTMAAVALAGMLLAGRGLSRRRRQA